MQINKVLISGRIKNDPYQVPERDHLFARFLVSLPKERNTRRPEPDTMMVEAAGHNAATILKSAKAGMGITIEGRLRSGVSARGDERHVIMLIRLESFSLNMDVEMVEDPETASRPPRPQRTRDNNRESRRENHRGKPSEGEAESALGGLGGDGGEGGDGQRNRRRRRPRRRGAEDGNRGDANRNEAGEAATTETAAASEAPVVVAPAVEPAKPTKPNLESADTERLKGDMPF